MITDLSFVYTYSHCFYVTGLNDIELRIEPSKREVHYGDNVDLRCLTVTPQKMQMYWSRADGSSLPSNARQIGEVLRSVS